jgi:hypothetical protein
MANTINPERQLATFDSPRLPRLPVVCSIYLNTCAGLYVTVPGEMMLRARS